MFSFIWTCNSPDGYHDRDWSVISVDRQNLLRPIILFWPKSVMQCGQRTWRCVYVRATMKLMRGCRFFRNAPRGRLNARERESSREGCCRTYTWSEVTGLKTLSAWLKDRTQSARPFGWWWCREENSAPLLELKVTASRMLLVSSK